MLNQTINLFMIGLLLFSPLKVIGASSDHYRIDSDAINLAGDASSGANYQIEDSAGQINAGSSSGGNIVMDNGFFADDAPYLSFYLDTNRVDLGDIFPTTIAKSSIVLTVSSNVDSGYTITARDNGADKLDSPNATKHTPKSNKPNDFIDLPMAGTFHFGLVVTGDHADQDYHKGNKMNRLSDKFAAKIGSHAGKISGDKLNVEFRASAAGDTDSGIYQTSVTFTCTPQF